MCHANRDEAVLTTSRDEQLVSRILVLAMALNMQAKEVTRLPELARIDAVFALNSQRQAIRTITQRQPTSHNLHMRRSIV